MTGALRQTTVLCALCVLAPAFSARADGGTLMPGGALSIGRAGAIAADPSDAMTLLNNPAGLTALRDHQAHYGVDMAIDSLCVQPYGYYGWGVVLPDMRPGTAPNVDVRRSEFGDPASAAYGLRPLDSVCDSGRLVPMPQLAVKLQVFERLSIGFGLLAPVGITSAQWGGANGTIATEDGSARPTPTRYAQVRQDVRFALDPTFGVAYRALSWLSIGASLQVEMAALDNYQVMALRAGTSPSTDVMTKLSASDYFIPSITVGAYANPSERWHIGATFNYSQGFDGSGNITFTTNYYHAGATDDEFVPVQNAPVKMTRIRVPVPWTATLAIRYAQPSGADEKNDPMRSELWDVEFDASYIGSGSMGPSVAEVSGAFNLQFARANGVPQMPLEVKQENLAQLSVDHHGLDAVALRLGGSWNVVPGLLQASAGTFFQSRSVQVDYVNIDNYGLARVGVGGGLMVRLGPLEVLASYAHIFQETVQLAPPPHEPREQASDDPKRGFDQRIYEDGVLSAQPVLDPRVPARADGVAVVRQNAVFESEAMRARVVNAGRYTAGFDILSIAVTHRF